MKKETKYSTAYYRENREIIKQKSIERRDRKRNRVLKIGDNIGRFEVIEVTDRVNHNGNKLYKFQCVKCGGSGYSTNDESSAYKKHIVKCTCPIKKRETATETALQREKQEKELLKNIKFPIKLCNNNIIILRNALRLLFSKKKIEAMNTNLEDLKHITINNSYQRSSKFGHKNHFLKIDEATIESGQIIDLKNKIFS